MTSADTESENQSYPVVVIRWVDSSYPISGWMSLEDAIAFAEDPELIAISAGFLLHEDETHVTVALSLHAEQAANLMRIPKCSIKSLRKIETMAIADE